MSLCLALALTCALPIPQSPTARFSSSDGWATANTTSAGHMLAPLTSLSERVTRAGFPDGVFRVDVGPSGEAPQSVVALVHQTDEFVCLDGERPVIASRVSAPHNASGPEGSAWDLAHLVRRDGHCVAGGRVTILPPSRPQGTDRVQPALLLFGADSAGKITVDGIQVDLRDHPLRPTRVEAQDAAITIELGSTRLDCAMFADILELPAGIPLESHRDGDSSVYEFAWSEAIDDALLRPGTTATLLIQWEGAAGPSTRSDAAAVDQAAAGDAPLFQDVSRQLGLDFVHFEGESEQLDIRPTMGPGAAWGDVNEDGWLDLVILQGAGRPGTAPLADRLYLGSEGGGFRDATAQANLGRGDAGMGALLLDVDGDGSLDLYCANYGQDRLFLGAGDGTFEEATELLPALSLWSASVTAADPDGDGDLDLYITSYLDYDLEKMPPPEVRGRYQREDPVEMLPFAFPGQRNVYLRNTTIHGGEATGKLGFEDATEELGLIDAQGRGMQTVFWDFDGDGDQDLYVANDVSFNVLFRNEGDGSFKDVSFSTGLDDPRGGMGLSVGDIDQDGDDDVFLTNWQLEANALYLNRIISKGRTKRRQATFQDYTVRSGLGPSGIGKTSWGAELFDMNLDGHLDLYVANGYTSPDYESTGICVGQSDQLFLGDGTGRFSPAEELPPAIAGVAQATRGAIGADYDRDGDVDMLVTANNGRALLLQNDAARAGHWLGIRLRQDGPNTRAIGADVAVIAVAGARRRQSVRAGQGYLTGNAPELHFGLGAIEARDGPLRVEVTWPDGETSQHGADVDAWTTITRSPR